VQTPQAFRFDAILAAHQAWDITREATDDAQILRAADHDVILVDGDEGLEKLTSPQDFARVEARHAPAMTVRVGMGYDVHRLAPNEELWLGGVLVPHEDSVGSGGPHGGGRRAHFSEIVAKYLQKPTVADMHAAGAIFEGSRAFIDTGVVIFTGKAVRSFLSLLDDPTVNTCTSRGLDAHPQAAALRLELYSDMLHALRLSDAPPDLPTYFTRLGMSPTLSSPGQDGGSPYIAALKTLWRTLHSTPMFLIGIQTGKFCHLGTSAELLTLLCSATVASPPQASSTSSSSSSSSSSGAAQSREEEKLAAFARKYALGASVRSSALPQGCGDSCAVRVYLAPLVGYVERRCACQHSDSTSKSPSTHAEQLSRHTKRSQLRRCCPVILVLEEGEGMCVCGGGRVDDVTDPPAELKRCLSTVMQMLALSVI
jgi:hypothetical protein